ncbi:MAG: aminotransferase class III-fold pyridoxal phosphate-dependent enzyme, partial [Pyrinomonadaceae bacterium]
MVMQNPDNLLPSMTDSAPGAQAIQDWLISELSERLGFSPDEIDIREPFTSYGLSSREAVVLSGDLESWLGRQLPPTLVWDYPSIASLAQYLAGDASPSESSEDQASPVAVREPVAIIGIGCRFPGAKSPRAFWRMLSEGLDVVSEVPVERWDNAAFYDSDPTTPGKMNTRWGGFLEQVEMFDARFFGISTREAIRMDPQQRLLLEVASDALEDAGQASERLAGTRTGVFVGISNNDYGRAQWNEPRLIDAYAGTGNALSITANRLSYFFDFQGPSMAVDTACSSSLVAVHLACQNLWQGECALALAGGANLILSPEVTINFTKAGMMAPDGRCKAFDARANGFVRSEGAGLVVLKPLAQALADGDRVYAVIRGSAVNQDGRTNGLMAPNQQSQEALLREAYSKAGVSPSQIQYIEAHGTGTLLGDPIEVKALGAVVGCDREGDDYCAVGSVKTNLGHAEAAAGIAGLIKLALSLQHREIPPSLHFTKPNPYIAFDELRLRVQQSLAPWPECSGPARGGVSSFGFGGTNAHLVLEEAPRSEPQQARSESAERRAQLLPLSARCQESLQALARSYQKFFETMEEDVDALLPDICHTASLRRDHHEHRLALVFSTRDELTAQLKSFVEKEAATTATGSRAKLAFVFSGQGTQWWGMGRELFEHEPLFRSVLEECDQLLSRYAEWSLLEEFFAEESVSRLAETEIAQPVLFALQVALAALWRQWGIEPDAVLGHSAGEVAAAHVAGALSLEDAVRLIYQRGRVMQRATGQGQMAAVELPLEEVEQALSGYRDRLSVAAINSPTSTVISGDSEALAELLRSFQERHVYCRLLPVNYAFHSAQMEHLTGELATALQPFTTRKATLPIISTLTGRLASDADFGVDYWQRQIRQPVRFAPAVDELIGQGYRQFLEIGPHPALMPAIQECLSRRDEQGLALPSLRRGHGERAAMLGSLGHLYVRGHSIAWAELHTSGRRYVELPTYEFKRERYWMDAARQKAQGNGNGNTSSPEHETQFNLNALPSASTREEGNSMSTEADLLTTEKQLIAHVTPARRERILSQVRGIVGHLLEMDPAALDAHTPLLEIGADSIVLIEAIRTIEETFDVKLTIRQLFEDVTTLDALVTYLEANLPGEKVFASRAAAHEAAPASETQTALSLPTVAASPNGAGYRANETETTPAQESSVERLMSQQLTLLSQVMTQQLEVLRSTGSSKVEAVSPTRDTLSPSQQPLPSSERDNGSSDKTSSAWVPHKTLDPGTGEELNPRQQEYLKGFIERYTRRTSESKRQTDAYRLVHADLKPALNFRLCTKELRYPIIGARSQGSRLWDVDGNEYVDCTMGYGLNLFGHNAPFIMEAIREQLELGMHLGPQTQLAGEVAELIAELTGLDRVAFCNSGTEAVMTALRLARTATARNKVAIFAGSYHGTWDGILVDPQSVDGKQVTLPMVPGVPPEMVKEMLVLNYGSAKSLEVLKAHLHELAAVLVEPVQSRKPDVQPREFLHEVRRLTREAGVALIFDEVITGFRILPGGAQSWFGVQADLATYGKIIGGGLPIGAVAGKIRFMNPIDGGMWSYGDLSVPTAQTTLYSGTFCKHPLAMAAARAVLKRIKEDGSALYTELNRRTAHLAETLNDYFERQDVPLRLSNFGSLFRIGGSFQLTFPDGMDLLFYHLIEKGIYIWEGRNWFISTEHGDDEIERIISAVKESIEEMRAGGFFPPSPTRQLERSHGVDLSAAPDGIRLAPLTEAQRQLWFLDQLGDSATIAYNESIILKLRGALKLSAMRRAWQIVVDRHEALRTTFTSDGDLQRIMPELKIEVPVFDFSDLNQTEREKALAQWFEKESQRRFDLACGPLLRVNLLKLSNHEHLLAVTAHHIVIDGWSFGILLKELSDIYSAESRGATCELPAPLQYREYVEWQEEQGRSAAMAASEAYWLEQLKAPLPPLNLPADHPRPHVKSYRGARRSLSLDTALYQQLKRFSQQHNCTLFMTLLAAYLILLHRLTGQNDLVIGSAVGGRASLKGSERLIGYCSHLVAVRSIVEGHPLFAEYVTSIQRTFLEAYDHQDYPFARLINALNIPRDPSVSPVVAATFNLDRPVAPPVMAGLEIELVSPRIDSSKFDLSLNVTEISKALLVEFDYSKDLFEETTIDRMLVHFEQLLQSIVADADQPVSDIRLLTPAQEQQLVRDWNQTATPYPHDRTIPELFESQAARTPESVAVCYEAEQLTYRELNERANQLAHHLREQGVGAESLVGVMMQRSVEMVVSLLGILKAGGAYVPLDLSYPQERLSFMIEDAALQVIITQQHLLERLRTVTSPAIITLLIDTQWPQIAHHNADNLGVTLDPDNAAYVIYTSGSTGIPKGVCIPH